MISSRKIIVWASMVCVFAVVASTDVFAMNMNPAFDKTCKGIKNLSDNSKKRREYRKHNVDYARKENRQQMFGRNMGDEEDEVSSARCKTFTEYKAECDVKKRRAKQSRLVPVDLMKQVPIAFQGERTEKMIKQMMKQFIQENEIDWTVLFNLEDEDDASDEVLDTRLSWYLGFYNLQTFSNEEIIAMVQFESRFKHKEKGWLLPGILGAIKWLKKDEYIKHIQGLLDETKKYAYLDGFSPEDFCGLVKSVIPLLQEASEKNAYGNELVRAINDWAKSEQLDDLTDLFASTALQ